jgi:RimJ/RimL family protein N-acetyltransferase
MKLLEKNLIGLSMTDNKKISEATIEALSRNFFKEASLYGFKYEHYLKFVNVLLEQALSSNGIIAQPNSELEFLHKNNFNELPIETEELTIRLYNSDKDFELVNEWLKDKYGKYFLHSLITSNKMSIAKLLSSEDNLLGIISDKNKEIGMVSYLNIDKKLHKAELRKIIGDPNVRGKGFGKKATKLWMNYGKNKLKLRKIYLYTVDTNIRNIKLNEELGFKVEGILRNEVRIDNRYQDVLRMGILL